MIIAGPTGIGKSWLILNIIKAVAGGTGLFGNSDWKTQKTKVLLVESEVGITLGERLSFVFQSCPHLLDEFHILSQPEGFSLSYNSCQVWLKKVIADGGFGLVILDPIGDLAIVEENSNRDVNVLMNQIRDIQGDAAVIMAHHTAKPPQDRSQYDPLDINNVRGAGKFNNVVDVMLTLNREPGQLVAGHDSWKLAASWEKTRHAPKNPGRGFLHFNEHGDFDMQWRGGVTQAPRQARERSADRYSL